MLAGQDTGKADARVADKPLEFLPPGHMREGDAVHEVQPGETVFGIAEHYGVQPDDLIAANRLAIPEYIRPGEYLTVPRPAEASRSQIAGSSVEVVWTVPAVALQFR